MFFSIIKPDDKLEISEYPDGPTVPTYLSKLEEKLEDSQVVIYMPISKGQLIKLSPYKPYFLKFFSTDGTMIAFRASILKYIKKGNFHFIIFKLTDSGERLQRRQFFRFSCHMTFQFSKHSEQLLDGLGFDIAVKYDGIVQDIGGGGIRFVSNEHISINDKINCILNLDSERLYVEAAVINVTDLDPRKAAYKYQYRVRFENISAGYQERIVQYIFNEQRRIVKRK